MGAEQILLQGDGYSNKMNAATKHVSNSTTQVGQDHVVTRVLLVLGTNTQPPESNTPNAHRKSARLAACATPIRTMACASQTGDTGQTGGQGRSGWWLQQRHRKRSR
jgi:hypothetical protein